jgi:hypothetical protein
MNALKSGIHAKSLVLPSEKLPDLEQLIADYYQRHDPDTPEARFYLDEVIHCEWLLRRYRTAETQMWKYENESSFSIDRKNPLGKSAAIGSNHFSKLQYRVDATRRAYQRALKALKELKAEATAQAPLPVADPPGPPSLGPSPQTTSPAIGFVPPSAFTAPPEPLEPAPTGQYPSLPPSHPPAPPLGAVDGCFGRVLR